MTDVADHAVRPANPFILKWDAAAFSYIQNNRIDNVPDPMPGTRSAPAQDNLTLGELKRGGIDWGVVGLEDGGITSIRDALPARE